MTKPKKPEWLTGTALSDDGQCRRYIMHTTVPRFVVRIVQTNPDGTPYNEEGDVVDDHSVTCAVRGLRCDTMLCEPDWIDALSREEQNEWLFKTADALVEIEQYAAFGRWAALRPTKEMARRLRLDLSPCRTWEDFTDVFQHQVDKTKGKFLESVKSLVSVLSMGEVPVVLAMLHAADYSRLADELGGDDHWFRLSRTYGDHAEATALPIVRA